MHIVGPGESRDPNDRSSTQQGDMIVRTGSIEIYWFGAAIVADLQSCVCRHCWSWKPNFYFIFGPIFFNWKLGPCHYPLYSRFVLYLYPAPYHKLNFATKSTNCIISWVPLDAWPAAPTPSSSLQPCGWLLFFFLIINLMEIHLNLC